MVDVGVGLSCCLQRLPIANGLDAISPHGDGLMHGHLCIHGEELSIDE